jgi:hypothetical protein
VIGDEERTMNSRNGVFGLMGGMILALSLTAAAPARAQAANQPECTTMDLAGMPIVNDCTGEVVTLTSGTMTTCAEAVFDASGGGHAIVRVQGEGFGVSDSGSRYIFRTDVASAINLPSSGTEVVTAVASAVLIGQGSAPNEGADILLHVTVDANGTPTAMVDKVSMRCPG